MKIFREKSWLHHIKAVIFDFDGTLAILNINFSSMRDQVWDLMKYFGIKEEWIRERYLLEIIDEIYFILWERNSSEAGEFYQRAHQILHEIELKAAEEGRLFPGAEATLKILREKGMKVGIVTRNCEDAVRKVFPQIDQYCDIFVSRNSIKKVKPHPDQLTHVIESLKVSEKEAVMVGDHSIDIQAGKRMGMKTIGVLTGRTKREEFEIAGADYILKDVSEIYSLLKEE